MHHAVRTLSPRARRVLAFAALLGVFLSLRLLFLRADPPNYFPNAYVSNELLVEPAAKSQEARNAGLFGAFQTSPADGYQFWRLQSPAWVYPLALWFRGFGVSYASLRVFAVLASALGFAAVLAIARRRLRGASYLLAGLFIAANYYDLQYSRVGLIEPLLNAFLALTVLFLLRARGHVLWLLAAEATYTLALLTKQSAVLLLPLVLVLGVYALLRGGAPSARRRLFQALVAAEALAICAGLAWYVTRPGYVRTLVWNYGHILMNSSGEAAIRAGATPPLGKIVTRLLDAKRTELALSILPLTWPLAALGLLSFGWRALVRRRVELWSFAIVSWLVLAWTSLLVTDEIDLRFRLALVAPSALLAASAVEACLRTAWMRRRRWARPSLGLALAGAFAWIHGDWYAAWVTGTGYSLVAINAAIRRELGDAPAVVVGAWSPLFVLETPYRCYYVKDGFNADRDTIVELGVTHMLFHDGGDNAKNIFAVKFAAELAHATRLASYPFRGLTFQLLALEGPLPRVDTSPSLPRIQLNFSGVRR